MSLGGEGGLCFDGRAARGHAADAANVREVETELVHSIDVMRLVFAGFKDSLTDSQVVQRFSGAQRWTENGLLRQGRLLCLMVYPS